MKKLITLKIAMLLALLFCFAQLTRANGDSIYVEQEVDSTRCYSWFGKEYCPMDIYKMPYSYTANYPHYQRLSVNTGVVFGTCVAAAGVLFMLPENISKWNRQQLQADNLFNNLKKNIEEGPVVDHDVWYINYIMHPYCGALYYMTARSAGFGAPYSLLYSAFMSTFFWEYFVEAFAEIPSWQDLFITPLIGSALGEGFYLVKRHIVRNGYELGGSRILGHTCVFVMDPVNELVDLFSGKFSTKKRPASLQISTHPVYTPEGLGYGFSLGMTF